MQIANITLPRLKASGAENPFLKPIQQKVCQSNVIKETQFSRVFIDVEKNKKCNTINFWSKKDRILLNLESTH